MKSEDIDKLVRQLEERRVFLQGVLKSIRSAKIESGWDPLALWSALRAAAGSPLWAKDMHAAVTQAQGVAEEVASVAVLELESDIRDLCRARGWRVDGQWPALIVERAIELRVD